MLSGTTNKANFSFFLQQPNYELPIQREVKNLKGGFWTYGEDNLYPQSLWNMFSHSSQNKSVILKKQREIIGNGLYSDDPKVMDWLDDCNTRGESFHDIFEQLVLDYLIFGGFTTQMVFGAANNKLTDIFYVDLKNVRFDIVGKNFLVTDKWGTQYAIKPTVHPIYRGQTTGTGIYYYNSGLSRTLYPVPEYEGCLADIQTSIEISNYFVSQIRNGLFGSFKITIGGAGNMTEDEQNKIVHELERKFQGSSNAGRYFMDFVNDVNFPNLLIEPIPQDELDKRFVTMKDSVTQTIYEGHGVNDTSLFGVPAPSGLGQQKDPDQSVMDWQRNYIIPTQKKILRVLNKLLSTKFPKVNLKLDTLKPIFSFKDEIAMQGNMYVDEIRKIMQRQGAIENWEIRPDEVLRMDESPTTTIDETDKQLNSTPKPNPSSGITSDTQTILTGTTS